MPTSAAFDGIIVIGCPRSGTTLLRRLLDAHPRISCPGETYLFSSCARFLQSETSVDGISVGVLNGLAFAGFEQEDVIRRLREFAFGLRREQAARAGKPRWAEKTAVDAFHLREIDQLCGEHAYFVCVIRHGLDVALSMVEWCEQSRSYLPELHRYIRRYHRPLEAFCHAWVDVTQDIRNFSNGKRNVIQLRYEDLVTDSNQALSRVMDFIGESWDADLVSRGLNNSDVDGFSDWKSFGKGSIDSSSIGRWRTIPAGMIAELADIVNPTLLECGYDAVERAGPVSDEAARRRYELGLMMQKARRGASE